MLDFHVGGLIVSCGFFRWFGGIKFGCQLQVIQGTVGMMCIGELHIITMPGGNLIASNKTHPLKSITPIFFSNIK
jgi:hypothetical protein